MIRITCPIGTVADLSTYELLEVLRQHVEVAANTTVSYPWYTDLDKELAFIGQEKNEAGDWDIETVWHFVWNDDEGNRDVAAIGTLRIRGNEWSWEMSRMDGGDGAYELDVSLYGERFNNFFKEAQPGYRPISGKLP